METILLLANSEADGSLAKPALEALGAAKGLTASVPGSKLLVGLIGQTVQPAADRIAACGANAFLGVAGADFAPSRYATDAAAAEALARAAKPPSSSPRQPPAGIASCRAWPSGWADARTPTSRACLPATASSPSVAGITGSVWKPSCSAPSGLGSSWWIPAPNPPGTAKAGRPPSKPSPWMCRSLANAPR